MTKISIITINLNNKAGLEKTILSVIQQTSTDFEYIVIDGGSNDGSIDVINQYADKITYWVSEQDNGIYNAMNKGIAKATGEYCLFLNSGDYLYDNNVLNKFINADPIEDIVYGNIIFDYGEYQNLGLSPTKITLVHLMRDTLWHPASFIKLELFDKIGLYNESFQIAGDYDFFLKALILYNCSNRHVNITISVYNLLGISSQAEFCDLTQKERKLSQNSNLRPIEIELYHELNNRIQQLEQKNIQLHDNYNSLSNSKTLKYASLLKKLFFLR